MAKRSRKDQATIQATGYSPASSGSGHSSKRQRQARPPAPPTTSTQLRDLGIWLIVLGLVIGLSGLAKLGLSQDLINNTRINEGPDAMHGYVLRCWIFAAAGLSAAILGALLFFLNPIGGAMTKVQLVDSGPTVPLSTQERLANLKCLLDTDEITDAEYQEQRKRILDQS